MRQIERTMLQAIHRKEFWKQDNTAVDYINDNTLYGARSEVYLHGNHIANYWHETKQVEVNEATLRKYPTSTTKSRLRALGVNVTTKAGTTYLNGVEV